MSHLIAASAVLSWVALLTGITGRALAHEYANQVTREKESNAN